MCLTKESLHIHENEWLRLRSATEIIAIANCGSISSPGWGRVGGRRGVKSRDRHVCIAVRPGSPSRPKTIERRLSKSPEMRQNYDSD